MDDKVKFELTSISEPIDTEKSVKTSIEAVKEEITDFSIKEIPDREPENNVLSGVSSGNIKANTKARALTNGYVYGGIFIIIGVAALLIAFLLEGYKIPGIICAVLAFLASYAMLKHVIDAKRIKALLDSGECQTVDELMLKLKRKNKYEFMRDFGGMIKAGYIAGYEVIAGDKIKKIQ